MDLAEGNVGVDRRRGRLIGWYFHWFMYVGVRYVRVGFRGE
jgi:hypothetical protein